MNLFEKLSEQNVQMEWKCCKNSRNAIHRSVANKGQSGSMPNVSDIGLRSISFNRWNLHRPSEIQETPWSEQRLFKQRHWLKKEARFSHQGGKLGISSSNDDYLPSVEFEGVESDIWMHPAFCGSIHIWIGL